MKISKLREEIKKADDVQLDEVLERLRKQLFAERINSATAHVKDYSQFKKLRRHIARVLTERAMREKTQEQS